MDEPVTAKALRQEPDARLRVEVHPDEVMGFSEDDLARIHDGATAALERIQAEKRVLGDAHLHEVPHDPKRDRRGAQVQFSDEEGYPAVCHDCGRDLVSDRGEGRLLVCPKLHALPHGLRPKLADGAVECGQSGV